MDYAVYTVTGANDLAPPIASIFAGKCKKIYSMFGRVEPHQTQASLWSNTYFSCCSLLLKQDWLDRTTPNSSKLWPTSVVIDSATYLLTINLPINTVLSAKAVGVQLTGVAEKAKHTNVLDGHEILSLYINNMNNII